MYALCRVVSAVLAAVVIHASPVHSTSFSVDQSDLWWVSQESGWGMQLVQRGSVIFATIFVYGSSGTPTWYTAAMSSTDGATWTGDLYATTGPWFGTAPFDPAVVTRRKVGTMTWVASTATSGTLNYVVDGVAVAKIVARQPLVVDDYSGTYLGAAHFDSTSCTNPADNGAGEIPITITVSQQGASISIAFSALGESITITGALSQLGQFGSLTGTYADSFGDSGIASASALNVQANALAGNFTQVSSVDGCHTAGYFAGMRSRP
jgi:hypothetical protein